MRVAILDGESVIGHADLTASDPPMGVASGAFQPSASYNRAVHADVIDGEFVPDRGVKLRVLSETYGPIESHAISIQDFPILNEIFVDVLGIISPSYGEMFSSDPSFRSYNRLDIPEEERLAQDRAIEASLRARAIRGWLWLLGILGAIALLLIWIF